MKRHTVNMFALTNEDLPLFSGAAVAVEVDEFNPPAQEEEVKPMPMFEEQRIAMLCGESIAMVESKTIAQKVDEYIKKYGDCHMTYRQHPALGTVFELNFNLPSGQPYRTDWVNYA